MKTKRNDGIINSATLVTVTMGTKRHLQRKTNEQKQRTIDNRFSLIQFSEQKSDDEYSTIYVVVGIVRNIKFRFFETQCFWVTIDSLWADVDIN